MVVVGGRRVVEEKVCARMMVEGAEGKHEETAPSNMLKKRNGKMELSTSTALMKGYVALEIPSGKSVLACRSRAGTNGKGQ